MPNVSMSPLEQHLATWEEDIFFNRKRPPTETGRGRGDYLIGFVGCGKETMNKKMTMSLLSGGMTCQNRAFL